MKFKHIVFVLVLLLSMSLGIMSSFATSAEKMNMIPTTYQGVAFSFGGFSKREPVDDILNRMEQNHMRGTFFVTEQELKRNAATVQNIVNHGQELGIGVSIGKKNNTQASYEGQIQRVRNTLQRQYGIDTRLVRQMYGAESEDVKKAVVSQECQLIGQTRNIVLDRDKDVQDASLVINGIFKKWDQSLGRGDIIYIRTDFYTNPKMAGDVMMAVKKQKVDNIAFQTLRDSPATNPANDSAYGVCSVGDILNKTQFLWSYPVKLSDVPRKLQPGYVPVHVDDKNFKEQFLKRYIGNPDVNALDRMFYLDRDIMRKSDKTGQVKSVKDNTIFFTFDDWGNDVRVNRILYVLRKHHVPATFFIITKFVPSNPNLLRAIALSGNDIGGHTDLHQAMAERDAKGKIISFQSSEDYYKNVAVSYEKLVSYVGDVRVNGKYSLTRLFRPPTLAISKDGAKDILNAGYTFIVNAACDTEDYRADSLPHLVSNIKHGIYDAKGKVKQGAIFLMHMSRNARFTPEALDIILTYNEKLPDNDPKKFKVGRLSDYLTDDYSQMMK